MEKVEIITKKFFIKNPPNSTHNNDIIFQIQLSTWYYLVMKIKKTTQPAMCLPLCICSPGLRSDCIGFGKFHQVIDITTAKPRRHRTAAVLSSTFALMNENYYPKISKCTMCIFERRLQCYLGQKFKMNDFVKCRRILSI